MVRDDVSIHGAPPAPPPVAPARGVGASVAVLVGVALLLLVPLPEGGRVFAAVMDLGHVILGAVLVAAFAGLLRRPGGLSAGAAIAIGLFLAVVALLAVEVLQPLVGRDGSLEDAVAGAAGAAGAALFAWAFRPRAGMRWLPVLLGTAAFVYGARLGVMDVLDALRQPGDMPVLAGFESELELRRWCFQDTDPQRVRAHATQGDWSLRVPVEAGHYPKLSMIWPTADWRAWDTLAFDVRADGAGMLGVVVQVLDDESEDQPDGRYERRFLVDPSSSTVEIPLGEIEAGPARRTLDLGAIAELVLVFDGSAAPRTVLLDDVRLLRTQR